MSEDRKRLRELCEKATQGEWWIDSRGHRVICLDSLKTVFATDSSMGPATRHPETGNLSHWPNDWDASYIVAVQPKVVCGLLDEIDRLNALVIERETVRIGRSLQRHDDQKQIDELVSLGIQQDKDEIARLKAETARWQQNYEHLIEQHMPRTGHGCEEGWSRVVEARELQAENTELKAALVGLFDEYKAGADSGDWGHWRVEETEAGQVALKSINRLIRQEPQA